MNGFQNYKSNYLYERADELKNHTKILCDYWGYDIPEDIACVVCGNYAVDCHHIEPRKQGMYDDMLDKVFLDLKFNEEKISIEERKARSRQDKSSIEFRVQVSKAQEIMDNCKAELDRVLTKKEFILDANATSRAEAKLGSLIT